MSTITRLWFLSCLVMISLFVSQAAAVWISPGYDLFATPSGGTSYIKTPYGQAELQGVPFGPGDTDTIIKRINPVPNPIPANGTGTFDIEIMALFLKSVNPLNVGGNPADLYITINKLGLPNIPQSISLPASSGMATITSHDDSLGSGGGGKFDSFFDVFADVIITMPGGDPNNPADRLSTQIFTDHFIQTGGTWSHAPRPDDPHNALFPAGNFYPGVDPVTGDKVLTPEQALLAQHGVLPGQVPEPTTWLLFSTGMAGGILITRRRVGPATNVFLRCL